MAEFVLAVLAIALVLYAVFGGADFGAGIIELFLPEDLDIDIAIAPVWEANHVWLVLALVLTFVGFPEVHSLAATYLHLPLLGVLLGIIARGAAFTFRHYDPNPGALRTWYNLIFRVSSFTTPLSLGVCMAALVSAEFPTDPKAGFYAWYVAPWNTAFGWVTGLFVCAMFAFEGAALLASELAQRGQPLRCRRIARTAQVSAIALGAVVFAIAYVQHAAWLTQAMHSPWAIAALVLATLFVIAVVIAFHRGHPWLLRVAMGAQVSCVLFGLFAGQFPVLLRLQDRVLTFQDAAAPPATLRALVIAIVVGLSVILPSLTYLIRVYKAQGPSTH